MIDLFSSLPLKRWYCENRIDGCFVAIFQKTHFRSTHAYFTCFRKHLFDFFHTYLSLLISYNRLANVAHFSIVGGISQQSAEEEIIQSNLVESVCGIMVNGVMEIALT